MKTVKTGIAFGFSAVNAGQRNTTLEPQVIAVSTEGNFRITPAVSKVLGVGHGDNIMFLSNVDNIDAAILAKDATLVEFCEANGLEIGTPEAMIALHKEFDSWAIAKGIQEYDPKGNVRTGTERLTKNDKLKFVSAQFDSMLEQALAEADQETKDALSRDGITKEEQADILSAFVTPREVPKFKGSKAANPGGLTGAGTSLTFTDSNVWKQIKVDMGDDATKMNRVFDVDVEDIQDVTLSDGFKEVTVKALVLSDYTDKEPARIGAAAEEAE
jgi:hypothetical protein